MSRQHRARQVFGHAEESSPGSPERNFSPVIEYRRPPSSSNRLADKDCIRSDGCEIDRFEKSFPRRSSFFTRQQSPSIRQFGSDFARSEEHLYAIDRSSALGMRNSYAEKEKWLDERQSYPDFHSSHKKLQACRRHAMCHEESVRDPYLERRSFPVDASERFAGEFSRNRSLPLDDCETSFTEGSRASKYHHQSYSQKSSDALYSADYSQSFSMENNVRYCPSRFFDEPLSRDRKQMHPQHSSAERYCSNQWETDFVDRTYRSPSWDNIGRPEVNSRHVDKWPMDEDLRPLRRSGTEQQLITESSNSSRYGHSVCNRFPPCEQRDRRHSRGSYGCEDRVEEFLEEGYCDRQRISSDHRLPTDELDRLTSTKTDIRFAENGYTRRNSSSCKRHHSVGKQARLSGESRPMGVSRRASRDSDPGNAISALNQQEEPSLHFVDNIMSSHKQPSAHLATGICVSGSDVDLRRFNDGLPVARRSVEQTTAPKIKVFDLQTSQSLSLSCSKKTSGVSPPKNVAKRSLSPTENSKSIDGQVVGLSVQQTAALVKRVKTASSTIVSKPTTKCLKEVFVSKPVKIAGPVLPAGVAEGQKRRAGDRVDKDVDAPKKIKKDVQHQLRDPVYSGSGDNVKFTTKCPVAVLPDKGRNTSGVQRNAGANLCTRVTEASGKTVHKAAANCGKQLSLAASNKEGQLSPRVTVQPAKKTVTTATVVKNEPAAGPATLTVRTVSVVNTASGKATNQSAGSSGAVPNRLASKIVTIRSKCVPVTPILSKRCDQSTKTTSSIVVTISNPSGNKTTTPKQQSLSSASKAVAKNVDDWPVKLLEKSDTAVKGTGTVLPSAKSKTVDRCVGSPLSNHCDTKVHATTATSLATASDPKPPKRFILRRPTAVTVVGKHCQSDTSELGATSPLKRRRWTGTLAMSQVAKKEDDVNDSLENSMKTCDSLLVTTATQTTSPEGIQPVSDDLDDILSSESSSDSEPELDLNVDDDAFDDDLPEERFIRTQSTRDPNDLKTCLQLRQKSSDGGGVQSLSERAQERIAAAADASATAVFEVDSTKVAAVDVPDSEKAVSPLITKVNSSTAAASSVEQQRPPLESCASSSGTFKRPSSKGIHVSAKEDASGQKSFRRPQQQSAVKRIPLSKGRPITRRSPSVSRRLRALAASSAGSHEVGSSSPRNRSSRASSRVPSGFYVPRRMDFHGQFERCRERPPIVVDRPYGRTVIEEQHYFRDQHFRDEDMLRYPDSRDERPLFERSRRMNTGGHYNWLPWDQKTF